ncbi:MAG: 30S ribosomal protein S1 [Zetaproteobacteria bacterium]|nr:MAG: 30S ribosomal protein S1 [Zetaproteobacteria bacterium]
MTTTIEENGSRIPDDTHSTQPSPEQTSGNGQADAKDADEQSFKQMFEESLKQHPVAARGQLVSGLVVGVDHESVMVDVGGKNEGIVPLNEFEKIGEPVPAIGESIEVMVQSTGGTNGVNLSVLAAKHQSLWKCVDDSLVNGTCIPATVQAEVKGGLRVDLGGLSAFLPRSEIDINPSAPGDMIGQQTDVVVLTASHKPENIVVSRKRPLEAARNKKRQAFFASAAVGNRISGEIKRLTDFGAFVDVGGVDALLHVSDIAWRRLKHPSEALQVGQQITAEIIKLNEATGKVSLSLRTLQPDPWENVPGKYQAGMRLTGTVRKLLDYGAMVEIEPGVEGMIHRSEMSWTRQDINPAKVLAEGDVVDVAVLTVDEEKRRISLSLKEVTENPWQAWLAKHPAGMHVKGTVRSITDFGLFVGLDGELDGLVHIGNLSWHESGEKVIASYAKGNEVECVVLGVDVERQRIALGIKQLEDDPFEVFLANASRGSRVEGRILTVDSGAFTVELMPGVTAYLSSREVPREHAELKPDSTVEAKIIELDRKRRSVKLSVRQMLRDAEKDAVRNYAKAGRKENAPSALALELQRKLLSKKEDC